MIKAHKSRIFEALFDVYTTRLLKRSFHTIRLRADADLQRSIRSAPLVLCPNHSSWWDALLPLYLARHVFHIDSYAMMEEEQLRRYPFFRRIGVFSVDRGRGRDALRSLEYAAGLLNAPGRALWLYPQGELRPHAVRPLHFLRGVDLLASAVPDALFVPMAFTYEFRHEQRPEIFISAGAAIAPSRGESLSAQLEQHVTALLDAMTQDLARSDIASFQHILQGRVSKGSRLAEARAEGRGR